jgi:hypothetical protein
MPADLDVCGAFDLLYDLQPAVANGFVAAFEGERPEPEPVLSKAESAFLYPLLGLLRSNTGQKRMKSGSEKSRCKLSTSAAFISRKISRLVSS